mmetsp:Transcript_5792/g.17292  ORF Transcript_5792/g.17292 Transcript_5792/m.17292 type:complete len:429 (-) Transcript_5792:2346-3632(-)
MATELVDPVLDSRIVNFVLSETFDCSFQGVISMMQVNRISIVRDVRSDLHTFAGLFRFYSFKSTPDGTPGLLAPAGEASGIRRCRATNGSAAAAQLSFGASLAHRDLQRGTAALFVPHLCVPWGKALGEDLWYKCRVKLEKTKASKSMHRKTAFDRSLGEYSSLDILEDERDYNEVIRQHVEEKFGRKVLSKIAMTARLHFVDCMLTILSRQILSLEKHVRDAGEDVNVGVDLQTSKSLENTGREETPCVKVLALQVPSVTSSAGRYIIHGSIVPGKYFSSLARALLQHYRVSVVENDCTVCAEQVDTHLRDVYHTTWAEIFPALTAVAESTSLREKVTAMTDMLRQLNELHEVGTVVRREVITRCIQLEGSDRGLLWLCALQYAYRSTPEAFEKTRSGMSRVLRQVMGEARAVVERLSINSAEEACG